MATIAPDLRPRGPAELYDAAIHLCTKGGTPLSALSLMGAVLPMTAGLALIQRVLTGKSYLIHAAVFVLGLMVRGIFAGAASLAGEAGLEDAPITAWQALRKALARGLSLSCAAGMCALVEWVFVPASLFIGHALWSPLFSGIAVVARGEAGPWGMGRTCRRRLVNEPTFAIRLLHGTAYLFVVLNLASGIAMGLYLSRVLMALDVTFLEQFASLKNPLYDLFVLALAAVVLEPVKAALGLLLLVDARVRSEGLDLRAAVDRLAARRAAKGVLAALALVLALVAPTAAHAIDAQTEGDLADLLTATGLDRDKRVVLQFDAARRLEGPEAAALKRFVDRVRTSHEAGETTEVLKRRLLDGLGEIELAARSQKQSADPRATAQSVLAQPEFEEIPETPKAVEEAKKPVPPDEDGLFIRFLKWLFKWIFGDPKESRPTPPPQWGGLGAGVLQVVTYVLLGLAIAVLAFVVLRAILLREKEEAADDEEAGGAAGAGEAKEEIESALSKAPRGWWTDADALAARGEHRAALRSLYLAVLAALHRRGAIEYDPTRSNWDYVRAFHGGTGELPPFKDLTARFDFAWYGRLGADELGYGIARELAAPLIQAEGDRGTDA